MTPASFTHIESLQRPVPRLLTYYILSSLIIPPLFPFVILPLYFRYHTLRYRFDSEGVSMRWGILFRREIVLNYARVQDIHIRANVIERWLGLARIELQTATGSSDAEMTLEGFPNFEEIRDFLYDRMRGAREGGSQARATPATPPAPGGSESRQLASILREIAGELRAIREALTPPEPPLS